MKKKLLKPFKSGLFIAAALLVIQFSSVSFAATFTAVASGNWSSSATWGGAIPALNNLTDQITIPAGVTVTMDSDVTLNGVTSQINVIGTLNSSPGRTFTMIIGSVSGSGTIVADHIVFGTGSTLFFSGSLTTNTFRSTAAGLQSSANMMINEELELAAGTMSVQSGGMLAFGSGATIHRSGGQFVLNGGNLSLGSNYHVRYTSGSATAGLEMNGAGLQNVTIDPGAGNTITLNHDLELDGTLTMTSGSMNLNDYDMTIRGTVAASGSGNIASTAGSNISIVTSNSLSSLRFHPSSYEVNNFAVSVGSANQAGISGTLNVRGQLSLTSGALWINSGELHIMGTIATSGSGTISASSTSNARVRVTASGSPGGAIRFTAGNSTLDDFTVNIGGNGSIIVASDLTINDQLDLTSGYINMGNYMLTLGTAAIINGGSSSAHIKLASSGSLNRQAVVLSGTMYPIGTSSAYLPARVTLNTGSSSGMVSVGVRSNVYSNGSGGIDISSFQTMVDATWDVQSSIASNLNMNLDVMWSATAEVNGFNRNASYISHYINGSWDVSAAGSATLSGGMYSRSRTNITSLSPFAVFDTETTASTKELDQLTIEVYPNPADDKILFSNIDFAKGPVSVDIISVYGQSVASYELTESSSYIPVNQLPKGNYFIQLNSNYMQSVKQFTKN